MCLYYLYCTVDSIWWGGGGAWVLIRIKIFYAVLWICIMLMPIQIQIRFSVLMPTQIRIRILSVTPELQSSADLDPYIFGPPRSVRNLGMRSGSGYFCHQAKIVRKTIIPTVF
jgi:hypothetical protein